MKWLRSAAERGHPAAQRMLGSALVWGKDEEPDLVEAWKWFELASAHDERGAAIDLRALQRRMTAEQIAEGKRRAAAFVPTKWSPRQ